MEYTASPALEPAPAGLGSPASGLRAPPPSLRWPDVPGRPPCFRRPTRIHRIGHHGLRPARRCSPRKVSFWDGRTPVKVSLTDGGTTAEYYTSTDYVEALRAAATQSM